MSTEDQKERQVLGVRLEDSKIPTIGAAAFICISELSAVVRGASVRGYRIPRQGPAVLYGPHHDGTDSLILYWLVISKAKRSLRAIARRDLLDPNYQEPSDVKQWAGNKKGALNNAPYFVRKIRAEILNIGAPVAVERLKYNKVFFEKVNVIIRSGQIIGIFPQGTRRPVGQEGGFMGGIALIAHQNPDVPFQAFRFFHNKISFPLDLLRPVRVLVGPPISFNQAKGLNNGRLTLRGFTHFLEDQVAALTFDKFI